jgi:hypothetical protein
MTIFNFFKKKKEEEEEVKDPEEQEGEDKPKVLACISYYITDEGTTYIDVEMSDYDEDSITLIASLVTGIHSGLYTQDTLTMLRNGLVKAGRPELYIDLVAKISSVFSSAYDGPDDSENPEDPETPFIKPSEILD